MRILLFVIIFLFSAAQANAKSCYTTLDCDAKQSCIGGKCSIRTPCMANAECPNQRNCLGARQTSTCFDDPSQAVCTVCKADSQTSDYYIEYNAGSGLIKQYYDYSCLQGTSIGGIVKGGCELDALTGMICWFQKLLMNSLGKWLVLLILVSLGLRILITGKPIEAKDLIIIPAVIVLIFGATQLISILTGVSAAVC